MKRKLSKNKVRILILGCILILILLLIYPCFIQRWTGSVNVNQSDIEKLNCLDNKNPEEIIKSVFEKAGADKISSEPVHYTKTYKSDDFTREITVSNSFTSMKIIYTFTGSPYSTEIFVAPKQDVSDLISADSNLPTDEYKAYYTLYDNRYDSVETLKNLLSEEIGKNRFVYDKFAKQGMVANVNYYISPQTANSRKSSFYVFPDKSSERAVFSVFEVGNYSVSIRENINFNDDSKYGIALNDFANLLSEVK